jgi:hypothetical protein
MTTAARQKRPIGRIGTNQLLLMMPLVEEVDRGAPPRLISKCRFLSS